jgi:hypothetical protein
MREARVAAFVLVVVGAAVSGATYVTLAAGKARGSNAPPGVHVVTGASLSPAAPRPVVRRARSLAAARQPQLLFRNGIADSSFGKLAVAPLSHPNGTRAVANLTCDRVYFAANRGLCLTATSAFGGKYVAKIFDAGFHVLGQLPLEGTPSRARISPSGRLGATTVFIQGDSYAPGSFSTRTNIISLTSLKTLYSLEKFKVLRNGKPFWNRNFNFWGVTFARDDNTFFATLGSGAQTYLVQGNLRTKRMRVIHEHVECPSLSPDGTRIAFKRSLNSHGSWRLYVLDLRTMQERPLAETSSIDDQAEWLDDSRVAYWHGTDIWVVPADGSGKPRKLVSNGSSPVVVRPAG